MSPYKSHLSCSSNSGVVPSQSELEWVPEDVLDDVTHGVRERGGTVGTC
jgi:hypothetical protein